MNKTRKILIFIAEKYCRDSNEIMGFCNQIGVSKQYCYYILSKLTEKGLIRRYWVRTGTDNNKKKRRYCISHEPLKLLAKI
jgi:DNA-binding PadR family transcriptional regulator